MARVARYRRAPDVTMRSPHGQTENPQLRLSLVVPIHNEAENVRNLLDEIAAVLGPLGPAEADPAL